MTARISSSRRGGLHGSRVRETGGVYVAVLVCISVALAVTAGALLLGGEVKETYTCQGSSVSSIGSGASSTVCGQGRGTTATSLPSVPTEEPQAENVIEIDPDAPVNEANPLGVYVAAGAFIGTFMCGATMLELAGTPSERDLATWGNYGKCVAAATAAGPAAMFVSVGFGGYLSAFGR